MVSVSLSTQDQEAWEIFCSRVRAHDIPWHELSEQEQIYYRMEANREFVNRNAPWRHP